MDGILCAFDLPIQLFEKHFRESSSAPHESCPVCLIEYKTSDKVKVLPCEHKFHPQCILPWLAKTNTCPFCRHELETDDEQYEEYRRAKLREKQREEDIETLHNSMFS